MEFKEKDNMLKERRENAESRARTGGETAAPGKEEADVGGDAEKEKEPFEFDDERLIDLEDLTVNQPEDRGGVEEAKEVR